MLNEFNIFEAVEDIQVTPLVYTFTDNTTLNFTAVDFYNYLLRKCTKVPTYVDGALTWLDAYDSLVALWQSFILRTRANYTRLKDALELEYNVLDNYNGSIVSTMTDTFDKDDTLSFNNRADTHTLDHSDILSFTDRTDTETLNNTDTTTHDTTNTVTNDTSDTTKQEGTVRTKNYVAGFNNDATPNVESYTDVTNGANNDDVVTTLVKSGTVTEGMEGTVTDAHSGTITNAKAGTETNAHSGTITDAKDGSEVNSQSGTITHEYTENKSGNLGITSSQQLVTSELLLRREYNLKDIILKEFIKEYCYY